jgi:hypothetical protein
LPDSIIDLQRIKIDKQLSIYSFFKLKSRRIIAAFYIFI